MEIASTVAITANNINLQNPSSPEPESEVPTRIQLAKIVPFTNGGVLKRHHHHHAVVVIYRECLKNHAAGIGGHALDGCGEFLPSPSSNPSDPSSLKCAACGCHRNFHRRDPDDSSSVVVQPPSIAIEFHPQNRHHPSPPPPAARPHGSPEDSASPPPISSSYMLLALSGSKTAAMNLNNPGPQKRFRTKFSQYEKKQMFEFAERMGWKMQKTEDTKVREFCRQIGVDKGVFKVWMHNNKNIRRSVGSGGSGFRRIMGYGAGDADNGDRHNHCEKVAEINLGGGANGSSSSS